MKPTKLFILLIATLFVSCQREAKPELDMSTPSIAPADTTESVYPTIPADSDDIDTRYVYATANKDSLIIENSFPRGGLKYRDAFGDEYVFAAFWSQIRNNTGNPVEISLNAPGDPTPVPSSPGSNVYFVLPQEEMNSAKLSMMHFGLTNPDMMVQYDLGKPSSLQKVIPAGEARAFYMATFYREGIKGRGRAGLSIKNDAFYYRVNDAEIEFGSISLKGLELQTGSN